MWVLMCGGQRQSCARIYVSSFNVCITLLVFSGLMHSIWHLKVASSIYIASNFKAGNGQVNGELLKLKHPMSKQSNSKQKLLCKPELRSLETSARNGGDPCPCYWHCTTAQPCFLYQDNFKARSWAWLGATQHWPWQVVRVINGWHLIGREVAGRTKQEEEEFYKLLSYNNAGSTPSQALARISSMWRCIPAMSDCRIAHAPCSTADRSCWSWCWQSGCHLG